MKDFTNLRTKEIPEIGVTGNEIESILSGMQIIIAENDGWPKRGTWQVLWQEEGCDVQELLWCNFCEGKSEYRYTFRSGLSSGSGETDSDRVVEDTKSGLMISTLGNCLVGTEGGKNCLRKIPSGLYENWNYDGVNDVLVINTLEGRIVTSMNVTIGRFETIDTYKYLQKDSEEQVRLRKILLSLAEVLYTIWKANGLRRFGEAGDTRLEKSIVSLRMKVV